MNVNKTPSYKSIEKDAKKWGKKPKTPPKEECMCKRKFFHMVIPPTGFKCSCGNIIYPNTGTL